MLLIDGYNLMHVTRFKPHGRGDGELRRSREALLTFLAQHLNHEVYPKVSIVFDSDRNSRQSPASLQWRHLQIHFAQDYASADEMIEILIRQHPTPQKLVVVSSDHRVQLAATRRGATAVDSDIWFDSLLETPREDQPALAEPNDKQDSDALFAGEDWLEFFSAAMGDSHDTADGSDGRPPNKENPFPPGYFEDLEDEFPGEL